MTKYSMKQDLGCGLMGGIFQPWTKCSRKSSLPAKVVDKVPKEPVTVKSKKPLINGSGGRRNSSVDSIPMKQARMSDLLQPRDLVSISHMKKDSGTSLDAARSSASSSSASTQTRLSQDLTCDPKLQKQKPNNTKALIPATASAMDNILRKPSVELKQFEEALTLYERAICLDRKKATYHCSKSAALLRLGHAIEAVVECKEAIQLDPTYCRAHHRLATIYLSLGEAKQALDHYKFAGNHADPNDITKAQALDHCLKRCTDAQKSNEWNTLLKETQYAITSGVDSAPLVYALQTEAFLKLHRHQEAYTSHSKGPNFTVDIMIKELVYMVSGRETTLLVKQSRAVSSARSSGNLLFNASKFSEASIVYSKGLEHDPYNSVLLCNRAACRTKLGQFEKTIEDCTMALKVQPSYSKARLRRADCSGKKKFSASLTLRNKVSLATTIASKLSPAQRKLFEETCFRPWLRVQHPGGDANLTHLWLQTMTSDLLDSIQRGEEEIWFHFPLAYTCFGRKEFCLITGLRFGHDDVGRYTRHITRPSWLSRVFPDESIEKPNLHVDDLKKLFNKKDGFTRMNDVDVVRVCLLLLLYAGFLGREAIQPIPQELILLVEDLNAWNLFPWGSYIWKSTWTKLSSAFDDRKSLRGDGSKYTLSGFVWAFKIWIFEAFPSMQTYALKTSNDIHRAISWKRKQPSPDRPDYTPLQREPSPIPSHHRASSPPSPHDRRPTKMPRLLSPCSPPPRDESRELRDEVAALREMVVSLQNEVHTLRNESSRIRRRARAIKSPYTPIVRRHRKKKPDSPVIPQESTPIVEETPIIPRESPPTVQEATVIVEEVPPTIQEPDSHGVICRILEKPSDVPDMMDSSCLSYELPASTIPVSEVERRQLPDTILDNTLWAKTAVDFYLHERSQGCFTDICKLNDDIYLLLDRSWWWWGVLLGVEDNGYFDGGNQRDESFALGNGQAKLYPAWWEVDKVFIPVLERKHWLLVELQLPSLKAITRYGNKKPKKLNITVSRDETAPQQMKGTQRGLWSSRMLGVGAFDHRKYKVNLRSELRENDVWLQKLIQ
ncbi:Tetratricopeptide repeat-containing protein, putative isoform 2 [Hibiscus syriacus]|uniref:Tetratricopeptide repeat-containing protein, putative isoform 2 n=1 Tax=Hibiscus syriacus TaxID=106335 RepID=A0A6A2WF38_HIBSY|nr:Tetratricopeptide repeat-containing protein, putative isoform 2 [Hibiscus syriacus]